MVFLAGLDQVLDVPALLLCVQLSPARPVLGVVLGRVEIRVQLVLVHLPEEVEPLRHGPGPVVEPLDDPREEGVLGTPGTRASIGHSAAHVTLIPSPLGIYLNKSLSTLQQKMLLKLSLFQIPVNLHNPVSLHCDVCVYYLAAEAALLQPAVS